MEGPRWLIERGRLPRRRWRVSFVAANGEKVVTGEGLNSKAAAVKAIAAVKREAITAPIEDRS